MSKTSAPSFDPRIIEQFAEYLYGKATAFMVGSVVCGVVFGMAVGAVPLTSLGETWPIPSMFGFVTMLLGGVFGGVIGYSIGDARSFGYKLQAQTALLQLEMERNAAETAYLMQLLVEGGEETPRTSATSAPASQPARFVPEPAAAPTPAPAPAPAPSHSEPPLSPPVSGPNVAAIR